MAKKQDLIHTRKDCGGTFQVEYTDSSIPFLVCDKCGHRIEDWVRWESDYKGFWQNEAKWTTKKDHLTCLLGFFAHLYQDYYGTAFTFSLNEKGLFRGPEMHQLRKLYGMLDGNVQLARDYISWIFEEKVKMRKKRITSLGFLATASVIQEFKLKRERMSVISRSTPLPEKMLRWVETFAPGVTSVVSLRDFGELNLLLTYYRDGHMRGASDIDLFIDKLKQTGHIDSNYIIKNWRE